MSDLDARLINAIDEFLALVRGKMITRIEKGEMSYKGAWRQMTIANLQDAIAEELQDAAVYLAMIQTKTAGTMTPPTVTDDELVQWREDESVWRDPIARADFCNRLLRDRGAPL